MVLTVPAPGWAPATVAKTWMMLKYQGQQTVAVQSPISRPRVVQGHIFTPCSPPVRLHHPQSNSSGPGRASPCLMCAGDDQWRCRVSHAEGHQRSVLRPCLGPALHPLSGDECSLPGIYESGHASTALLLHLNIEVSVGSPLDAWWGYSWTVSLVRLGASHSICKCIISGGKAFRSGGNALRVD